MHSHKEWGGGREGGGGECLVYVNQFPILQVKTYDSIGKDHSQICSTAENY